jgi:cell wall-associated NlpC family hydrolase
MRRALLVHVAALAVAAALAPGATAASWAAPQIKIVVEHGLMGPSVSTFRPAAVLTRAELGQAMAALTGEPQVVVDPQRAVTLAKLDARLVAYLGLRHAGRQFRAKLRLAGLDPPRRLGNETVARLLRLRTNHPASRDAIELKPQDPVTRAEAAWSLARLLEFDSWDVAWVNGLATSFRVPTLTDWRKRVLKRSVRFVGYPYIWGGTSENPQTLFGVSSHGGFDCSGFVWRVYKVPFRGGGRLADVIQGRTTYQMSGEVPRSMRIPFDRIRPADVVFFGDRGPRSSPSEVGHTGIYLGGGWMVHSSGQGTTLVPLTGWYADTFAWARRPLREAGL